MFNANDPQQVYEVKKRVMEQAAQAALAAFQEQSNRVTVISNELTAAQETFNRTTADITSRLGAGERERERLRIEAEIAKQLCEDLAAEGRRLKLTAELRAAGGPLPAPAVATAGGSVK